MDLTGYLHFLFKRRLKRNCRPSGHPYFILHLSLLCSFIGCNVIRSIIHFRFPSRQLYRLSCSLCTFYGSIVYCSTLATIPKHETLPPCLSDFTDCLLFVRINDKSSKQYLNFFRFDSNIQDMIIIIIMPI